MPSIKNILMGAAMASTMASAHMIMKTPTPYGTPDNSPLAGDGSNFPCKATTNAGATVNQMAIGAPQTLSFTGSAVHGGGSCQISLTKDTPATRSSKWMVIHSIEGGCPAKNTGGNLNQDDGDKYTFTVPNGIDPGAYTLAWTWFNKVGNREMYMNCASVQVTGASKKRDVHHPHHKCANESIAVPELSQRDTSFPDLFVANIPGTNCINTQDTDTQFPNPGSSVEKFGSGPLVAPSGPQCSAGPAAAGGAGAASSGASSGAGAGAGVGAGAGAGSGSGSSGAASSPAAAAASSPAAAAPSAQASAAVSPAMGAPAAASSAPFANASASSPGGTAGGAAAATPATGAAPSAPSSGSSAPAAAGSATGQCTTAGASICSPDGKQIGTCTTGMTVTWIPVADGTECKGGMMVMAGSRMLKSRSGRLLRWAF